MKGRERSVVDVRSAGRVLRRRPATPLLGGVSEPRRRSPRVPWGYSAPRVGRDAMFCSREQWAFAGAAEEPLRNATARTVLQTEGESRAEGERARGRESKGERMVI